MNNFALFVAGLAISLIAGMGVATSQVLIGYKKYLTDKKNNYDVSKVEI
jgi:hypothetical protein